MFLTRLVRRYRECPELGWGDWRPLDQPHGAVLASASRSGDAAVVTVHNLSPHPLMVPLSIPGVGEGTHLGDLLGGLDDVAVDERGRAEVPLDGYGHRWLRVVGPGDRALA